MTTYNGMAVYSCDPGYSLSGSGTHTCGADGSWSGNEPVCEGKTCKTMQSMAILQFDGQEGISVYMNG